MDKEEYIYLEKLKGLAQKIGRDVDAVIVEGRNDEKALKRLGMEADIFKFGGNVVEPFCERVAELADSVVILTDFDTEGKEMNLELRQVLEEKLDVMGDYRKKFGKLLTSKDRYCIEEINPLFHSIFDKFVDASLDRMFTDLG